MFTLRFCTTALGLAAGTLFMLGCNSNTAPVVPSVTTTSPDHDGHEHNADPSIANALASLSPADRAAAERQKVCPVTDEPLGSMGSPLKISLKGRDVFLCCEGCKDALQDDPDAFLAKLPQTGPVTR